MKAGHAGRLVLAAGLWVFAAGCGRAPEELRPTPLSAGWATLTNAEEGVEIKVPPGWSQNRGPTEVSLSYRQAQVGIRRMDADLRRRWEAARDAKRWFPRRPRPVRIGGLQGEQTGRAIETSGPGGNLEIESVAIERDGFTYLISWTLGTGNDKAPASFAAVVKEMVATFRFVPVKRADPVEYSDPGSGLTFSYPYGWYLHVAGGEDFSARLRQGVTLAIGLDFLAGGSFEEYQSRQGSKVTGVEAERALFRHQLRGRRFRWMGEEAYAIENNGGLLIVKISESPPPGGAGRKSVDEFLDSLRFQ